MSTLKILSFQNNSLSGSFPLDFGCSLSNLEELYLWGNKLSGRIPNTTSNASKLSHIDLAINKFQEASPTTLGNLRHLEFFSIAGNYLTIIDASNSETNFFGSLTNCRNLSVLDLEINPLNIKLPKSIGNLSKSLRKLFINPCGSSGKIPSSEMRNLTKLIQLSWDENVLTGPIPRTIKSLQALQYLSLIGNELSGFIIKELCQIKSLAYLYLSGNKFSGAVPLCSGNLTALQRLNLRNNKLISEIPSHLWNLKDILEVNLSSNNLVGNIPFLIENLKALNLLDLSRNQISGIIPTTIGGLQNLQILSLALNKLQGNIPESIGKLISLESLDISQNNLSGEIPKSLESLL